MTLAGTGLQGYDLEGGRSGRIQPISSPWDVALAKSPRKITNNNMQIENMCIAMLSSGGVNFISFSIFIDGESSDKNTLF